MGRGMLAGELSSDSDPHSTTSNFISIQARANHSLAARGPRLETDCFANCQLLLQSKSSRLATEDPIYCLSSSLPSPTPKRWSGNDEWKKLIFSIGARRPPYIIPVPLSHRHPFFSFNQPVRSIPTGAHKGLNKLS